MSQFLGTDDLKMALWARKVSGAFEKQASDPQHSIGNQMVTIPDPDT